MRVEITNLRGTAKNRTHFTDMCTQARWTAFFFASFLTRSRKLQSEWQSLGRVPIRTRILQGNSVTGNYRSITHKTNDMENFSTGKQFSS
jgi:hypothetical protein